jgi:hypothetical protein
LAAAAAALGESAVLPPLPVPRVELGPSRVGLSEHVLIDE